MELPIDHFRLLGVSPTTDAQAALQMLQQRLDRVPAEGYSLETLDARAELLRSSADLLSDTERRRRYESDLTTLGSGGGVIPALDIPSSLEVGGLVLLLEAGQPLECFELASRSLQPPRAPALGSSREGDLTLVAAQAALAGAQDLQMQRRYEAAAQLLLQGQQLLQRMGQLPRQRQQLDEAFEALSPYRVLDLLSRPLTASGERAEGLKLLDTLVQQRGGLEGDNDKHLNRDEFQTFFKQIRQFLTVQEQVDLFTTWGDRSAAADFLATTALTASGFVQRKPERIAAALARLEASDQSGTETLKAALQLLLGQVTRAQTSFSEGASPELLAWAAQQSSDPLAQLCAYCSDWLQRDVLPGYRDLEADADLDAYFADRDVQAFIEAKEPTQATPTQATAPSAIEPTGPGNPFEGLLSGLGLQGPPPEALMSDEELEAEDNSLEEDDEPLPPIWANWQWPRLGWPSQRIPLPALTAPRLRLAAMVAIGLGVAAGVAAVLVRQPWRQPEPLVVQPAAQVPNQPPAAAAPKPASDPAASTLPLTADTPSDAQLQSLLEAWLGAKAAVLAGRQSSLPLNELARESQVLRLEAQRASDAARGETQKVEATITALEISERSPGRIAVQATLSYRDSRLSSSGATVARTEPTTLVNRYVFARDGQTWRLVAFGRGN
ncbi:MAG: IMS domain-containing protein [Cyanobacteriota bacterium]|nr:IMS domain-containing protein [Cyanobacteriota bacterium]